MKTRPEPVQHFDDSRPQFLEMLQDRHAQHAVFFLNGRQQFSSHVLKWDGP
jgi:hypothetical protein